ncbi:MAG: hypothetical protein HRT89_00020 [Lentisphaeria bacterium]|nr:hypothetical protein [Lentisphaeria bacterium]NQZ66428.1 hypothetical protein [Lentisphaeria bacterium]
MNTECENVQERLIAGDMLKNNERNHFEDCDICQDYVETLKQIETHKIVIEPSNDLDSKVLEYAEAKNKRSIIPFHYILSAAALFLFMMLILHFTRSPKYKDIPIAEKIKNEAPADTYDAVVEEYTLVEADGVELELAVIETDLLFKEMELHSVELVSN